MTPPGLLADENIAAPMVHALRGAGWDVHYVQESTPGITDEEVLSLSRSEHRILLTEDKDFGELVFRLKRDIPGIVLLRLPERPWGERSSRVSDVLGQRAGALNGMYTVIEEKRIRSRPMPG